jgi:hypothetical protein
LVVEALEEVLLFTDTSTAAFQRFRVFFEFETIQSHTRLDDCGCTEWLKKLALNESLKDVRALKQDRTWNGNQNTKNAAGLTVIRDRGAQCIDPYLLLQLKCYPDLWLPTIPSLARRSDR